jgi:pyruvate,orthophosphate dikinase
MFFHKTLKNTFFIIYMSILLGNDQIGILITSKATETIGDIEKETEIERTGGDRRVESNFPPHPIAALKLAISIVKEGSAKEEEVISQFNPFTLQQLLHPMLSTAHQLVLLGMGCSASPGAACGKITFSSQESVLQASLGGKTILVLQETNAEDIQGMIACEGVLTSVGGITSHAAVVSAGMGKPCIVGCKDLQINKEELTLNLGNHKLLQGEYITLDGASGHIFRGQASIENVQLSDDFTDFMKLVDRNRRLKVRANAETVRDILKALSFGAEGIGVCRTEHMFFGSDRLPIMQKMILSSTKLEREQALSQILIFQKEDFCEIFKLMNGLPVTVRLLDPPLHEFLPKNEEVINSLSDRLKIDPDLIKKRIQSLSESNPMLGNRGCRLGITFPEIYETQVQALFEAATKAAEEGYSVELEIMIPFIAFVGELKQLREMIIQKATEHLSSIFPITYKIGAMIELPQAALQADKIAHYADFMSFGTNDLTQTTLGISRDDSSEFLKIYQQKGIVNQNPFSSLDESVKELIMIACKRARSTNPEIKLGICGEHGGDPLSIQFCEELRFDYVSCSPFRLPVAKLAAAQAHCKLRGENF